MTNTEWEWEWPLKASGDPYVPIHFLPKWLNESNWGRWNEKLEQVESEGDEIRSYKKSKVIGEKNPNINLEIQSSYDNEICEYYWQIHRKQWNISKWPTPLQLQVGQHSSNNNTESQAYSPKSCEQLFLLFQKRKEVNNIWSLTIVKCSFMYIFWWP